MCIRDRIHWDEFALECVDVVDNGGTAFEIIQLSLIHIFCEAGAPDFIIS